MGGAAPAQRLGRLEGQVAMDLTIELAAEYGMRPREFYRFLRTLEPVSN